MVCLVRRRLEARASEIALGLPLTVVVVMPTLFAVWLVWVPQSVELRSRALLREITTAPAPLSRHHSFDLATVVAVEETRLGHGRRTAGTSLPGYCVGNFSYDGLGGVWQATDCSRDVLVLRRGADEPIVLTPPDRDRFRAALESRQRLSRTPAAPQAR